MLRAAPHYLLATIQHMTAEPPSHVHAVGDDRLSTIIIDSFPGIFYLYDEHGRFLRWNREFERVSGFCAAEIRAAHPLDFFLESEHALLSTKIGSVFKNGFDEVEANFVSKDGVVRPYYFNGVRLDVDGGPLLMGVGFDISKMRKSEYLLRCSEKRLRLALAAAQMGIFDWDIETNAITWSRRHEELWGYAPGEFAGTYESFASRVHPEDLPIVNAELMRCQEAREVYSCEYRTIWPDKSVHWIEGTGEFEYDGQGKACRMRGVVMEVTARKELEQKYIHAQKMESVGQLAGGVAHDFNNLLTVIIGHCELAMATTLSTELKSTLVDIADAASRAAEITRQLLTFSRKNEVKPVLSNLNDIIADTKNLLKRLVGEDIQITLDLAEAIHCVRVDPTQIVQLLMNLATNARDAIGDSGVIAIGTSVVDVSDLDWNRFPRLRKGQHVQLAFEDSGAGIPEEHLDRIFDPFFSTKEVNKGTGLGLSVVYGIVEQANGCIQVSSRSGSTKFTILFPAATHENS